MPCNMRAAELRYSVIGEPAWPVEHKHGVYVRHHLLLIDPERAQMPSMTFGGGLAGRAEGAAAERHENQD
jgi:hypothetical protein